MVVTHGDADLFAGLSNIREPETEAGLAAHKRLFIHPERVFHNGLVKRPILGAGAGAAWADEECRRSDDPHRSARQPQLEVPASGMNKPIRVWRKALAGWQAAGSIEFRRLARGADDAFDSSQRTASRSRCSVARDPGGQRIGAGLPPDHAAYRTSLDGSCGAGEIRRRWVAASVPP
jgi:hypothetical protein